MNGNIDVLELNGQLDDYVSVEGTLIFGSGDMMKAIYDTNDNGIVDNAEMVNNHTVLTDVPADAVFTDTTYTAGTGISIQDGVISNTQTSAEWGNITGTLADQTDLKLALDSKASASDIPTKVSDLDNDTGFITNTVNNLVNYYNTTNSYSKTEVDTLISNINQFKLEIVQTLPTEDIDLHTIYLVPKTGTTNDVYDEYIYINNAWEMIGNTQIDLTNYVQKTDYATTSTGGVIKSGFGLGIGSSGTTVGEIISYANYQDLDTHYFISKGTLDNVFTGRNYELQNHKITSINSQSTDTQYPSAKCVYDNVSAKQDTLVSGTNIKTINNTSLLGSGNITLEADPEVAISTTTPTGQELIWINPEETPSGTGFELDKFYPVGSIYINTTGVNPSTFMGGTWEAFGSGKVLVGQDTTQTEFDTLLETGGSKYLQKHTHPLNANILGSYYEGIGAVLDSGDTSVGRANENPALATTGNAGTGESGNLQPYIVVSMWVRTA